MRDPTTGYDIHGIECCEMVLADIVKHLIASVNAHIYQDLK